MIQQLRVIAIVFAFILCVGALTQAANAGESDPFQRILAVGETAPDFSLPDQNGKVHHLSEYKGKIVVLAFYPADFTKGCTLEAHVNTEYFKQYQAAGLTLIGVSVQTPESHKAFCEKYGIPYTILADSKGVMAARYGVLGAPFAGKFPDKAWYSNPKESAALYYKLNPGQVPGLAKRITFIIGKNGKIAYVDSNVDSHLQTCAPDWINWAKGHAALLNAKE